MSTPVKAKGPGSPARSVKSTPVKSPGSVSTASTPSKSTPSTSLTPLKSPGSAGTPAKTSSAVKANAEGSWNLEGQDGVSINLETNVVNKSFQINKQNHTKDQEYDVEEEAKEVMLETALRQKAKSDKIEAFQNKTNQRADAIKKKNKKLKKSINTVTSGSKSVSSSVTSLPKEEPAIVLTRREQIVADKAAALSLNVKPLSKKIPVSIKKAQKQAEKEKIINKIDNELKNKLIEEKLKQSRLLAAQRTKDAKIKLQLKKDLLLKSSSSNRHGNNGNNGNNGGNDGNDGNSISSIYRSKGRKPLDAPLERNIALKTTAPKINRNEIFNINDLSVLQLSGLISSNGEKLYGVDNTMLTSFEYLSKIKINDIKEFASLCQPPLICRNIMDSVCILVGEDTGWVSAKKLLKRRDFFPALAVSNIENIPFARIKKFRSKNYFQNPQFNSDVSEISKVAHALLLWVLAIDSSAPPSITNSGLTYPDSTMELNQSMSPKRDVNANANTSSSSPSRASRGLGSNNKDKSKDKGISVRTSSELAQTILAAKAHSQEVSEQDDFGIAAYAFEDEDNDDNNDDDDSNNTMSTADADAEFIEWLAKEQQSGEYVMNEESEDAFLLGDDINIDGDSDGDDSGDED